MPRSLLKSSLALAAACALWAGSAQAATYDLNLTGIATNGFYSSQDVGATHYDQWVLVLDGLSDANGFSVEVGDTINTIVTLNQLFTVPSSVSLTSFGLILGGAFPGGDTEVSGGIEFYDGATLVKSGASSTSTSGQLADSVVFFPPDNGAFTFDSFRSSFTITTLASPAQLTYALATYSLNSPAVAVPEPAAWALMIMGFGGVGALMRRRRDGGRAAFA